MAIHTARIGWEHPKKVTPMLRPDIAIGEMLLPHFFNGVHVVSPSKLFGQWFI
jgi:hypothetical protein